MLLQEPGWTEVEDFGAEDDSDGHSLGRSLAYDNSSDSSEIGPPEILTLALSLNGVVPTCRALEGCGLNLTDAATPVVKRVTPRNGSYDDGINVVITLSMMDKPEQVQIFFGPFECPNPVVSQSGGDWTITVPLCSFEASKTPVYVLTSSGYAVGASPITGAGFYFEQLLRLSSIVASSGSFYGGTLVAIRGAGLGPSLGMNYATVGGTPCEVASASNDEVQCYTPAAPSELANANESTRTLEVKVHVMSAEVGGTVFSRRNWVHGRASRASFFLHVCFFSLSIYCYVMSCYVILYCICLFHFCEGAVRRVRSVSLSDPVTQRDQREFSTSTTRRVAYRPLTPNHVFSIQYCNNPILGGAGWTRMLVVWDLFTEGILFASGWQHAASHYH